MDIALPIPMQSEGMMKGLVLEGYITNRPTLSIFLTGPVCYGQWTLYTVHCRVHCTLYTVVFTVHCTLQRGICSSSLVLTQIYCPESPHIPQTYIYWLMQEILVWYFSMGFKYCVLVQFCSIAFQYGILVWYFFYNIFIWYFLWYFSMFIGMKLMIIIFTLV